MPAAVTRLRHFDSVSAQAALDATIAATTPAELRAAREQANAAGVLTLDVPMNRGAFCERRCRLGGRISAAINGE